MQTNSKNKQLLFRLILILIIFLLTFPRYIPTYGTGLDPSYVWALNHLFSTDYETLTQLTYPIGPLGFLKYSAAYENNLALALLFFSIFKLIFITLLLKLFSVNRKWYNPFGLVLVLLASYFAGFDYSIIGSVVIALLLYLQSGRKIGYFLLANLLAIVGLLVKSSIGISSYSVIFSYFFLFAVLDRPTIKQLLMHLAISFGLMLVVGTIAFRGLSAFFSFLFGTMQLAGGYSSGLALFPENNWWLLTGFILLMLGFPFLMRDRGGRRAWLLLLLPLFAIWKLAMGREDIYHYTAMFGFLAVYWAIILANTEKIKRWIVVFPLITILLFASNMVNLPNKKAYSPGFTGPKNFWEAVVNYRQFNEKYISLSKENVSKNELVPEARADIGDRTIDIYPWDLSYAAANQLNWIPRKTLELGASTSSTLSAMAASHYDGEASPDLVLLHLKNDKWGGKLGSIDGRYLLNDEPLVISNLISNYRISKAESKYLLFEKREQEAAGLSFEKTGSESGNWNQWMKIPGLEDEVSRAKIDIQKNLMGKLKTFLYKDEAYFIDYRLTDNRVLTYRFLASNGIDGLWVNPLVLNPTTSRVMPVEEIRIRCSNEAMLKPGFELEWEQLILSEGAADDDYFWHHSLGQHQSIYQSVLNFRSESKGWKAKPQQAFTLESGKQVAKISPKSYSSSLKIAVDSLFSGQLTHLVVEAGLAYRFKENPQKGASLVIAMEGTGNDFWKAFPLDPKTDQWKYAFKETEINQASHSGGILSVYVWNNSNSVVLIENFSVDIHE